MNKLYFGIIVGFLLTGCTSDTISKPAQITTSQNMGPCKIDQNLMDYHINKKKIRYQIKEQTSNLETSPLLAHEDRGFKETTVSSVENAKSNYYRNFISNQNKLKK